MRRSSNSRNWPGSSRRTPATYQQLGFLEARLGNLAAAERDFKQMLAIAPKNAAGYRSLAKFYLNTKREAKQAQELAADCRQARAGRRQLFRSWLVARGKRSSR